MSSFNNSSYNFYSNNNPEYKKKDFVVANIKKDDTLKFLRDNNRKI